MASNTPKLNLLKKDPTTDGNETFNIKTMLNDNWDKIDVAVGDLQEAVQDIHVPLATLDQPGIVQLSNATDSNAEDKAATPKAIKDAALQSKSYTDQQINLVTETGIPKLVSYPLKVTATSDNQTVFEIPLDLFDAITDTLLVAINRAVLDSTQYTVTNTVRNGAGQVTQRARITLLSGVVATSEVTMVVLKNVPIGPDGSINGAVLAANSVPINRVNGLQDQLNEVFQSGNERKAEVVAALVALGISASTSESWDSLIAKLAGIINRGAGGVITPGTFNQIKAAGYYNSDITILGDADLIASNFPKDVNLFGIQGVLERMTTAESNAIIAAIVAKGVAASASDSNAVLAQKIGQIASKTQVTLAYEKTGIATSSIQEIPIASVPQGTSIVLFNYSPTSKWSSISDWAEDFVHTTSFGIRTSSEYGNIVSVDKVAKTIYGFSATSGSLFGCYGINMSISGQFSVASYYKPPSLAGGGTLVHRIPEGSFRYNGQLFGDLIFI